jgi:hypothetical protein
VGIRIALHAVLPTGRSSGSFQRYRGVCEPCGLASQEFVALAEAVGVTESVCQYVGVTAMTKSYRDFATYQVRRAWALGSECAVAHTQLVLRLYCSRCLNGRLTINFIALQ